MIKRVVTSGTFTLDDQEFLVENNIWLVGDETNVIIIDAAHDHRPILDAVENRTVAAVIATHGHNDHINAAGELADAVGAPIWLHPADRMLWNMVYPERAPDGDLADGMTFSVGGSTFLVLHTPGHSPGGCCLYNSDMGVIFSGDTLFRGGPGATGRSFSDFGTIITSIRSRLLNLPGPTRVCTGHGNETTIGDEAPHLDRWIADAHA